MCERGIREAKEVTAAMFAYGPFWIMLSTIVTGLVLLYLMAALAMWVT